MVAAEDKLMRPREEAELSARVSRQCRDFEAIVADLSAVTRPYRQIRKIPDPFIALAEAVGGLPERLVGFPVIGLETDQAKELPPPCLIHQEGIQNRTLIHVLGVHENARPLGRERPRLSEMVLVAVRNQHIQTVRPETECPHDLPQRCATGRIRLLRKAAVNQHTALAGGTAKKAVIQMTDADHFGLNLRHIDARKNLPYHPSTSFTAP